MTAQLPPLSAFYLKPSELFVSRNAVAVTTVLGSCISVTMFHRGLGIGAICHAMLPQCSQIKCVADCADRFKYVNCVIPGMVQKLCKPGIKLRDIEVKLFGGADTMGSEAGKSRIQSVGRQNMEMAVKVIQSEGLHLKISNVGGCFGRKIIFYSHTGQVLLKRLNKDSYGM